MKQRHYVYKNCIDSNQVHQRNDPVVSFVANRQAQLQGQQKVEQHQQQLLQQLLPWHYLIQFINLNREVVALLRKSQS